MNGSAEILIVGTRDVFVADHCQVEHGAVHATGRWRRRWGPTTDVRFTYSEPATRTWPVGRCEIRWTQAREAA